mgnify:CR=1 FL=1
MLLFASHRIIQNSTQLKKIWTTVKNWVGERNVTFKFDDVKRLAEEKFSSITKEEWLSICNNLKQVEANYVELST